jgi:hypothetical protein
MSDTAQVQGPAATPRSGETSLGALRRLETRLYSADVEAQVRQLDEDGRARFVQARLQLTATVIRLQAAVLQGLRQEAERPLAALGQGVRALDTSLQHLEAAAGWARAIDGVLRGLGEVFRVV